MLQRDDDKQWTVQFDNLWEMSRWIDATPKVWNQKASRDNHGADWTLGHSYDDCLRMAREGWEEGIRSLSVLSASVPTIAPRTSVPDRMNLRKTVKTPTPPSSLSMSAPSPLSSMANRTACRHSGRRRRSACSAIQNSYRFCVAPGVQAVSPTIAWASRCLPASSRTSRRTERPSCPTREPHNLPADLP